MFFQKLQLPGRDDQQVTAIIISVFLIVAGFCFWQRSITNGGFINFEQIPSEPVDYVVDLNAANWPELANLPGIGEKLAKQIVDHREQVGPYSTAEQLMDIHGIGEAKLAGIRSQIAISQPPDQTAFQLDTFRSQELR